MNLNSVTVMGLGYIGLPTAALISNKGILVNGIDINKKIINKLKLGKLHFNEPKLDLLVNKVIKKGFLKLSSKISSSDCFIITVPTPINYKNKEANLDFVYKAIDMIISVLEKNNLLIIESTVPVGTTNKIAEYISKKRPDLVNKKNNSKFLYNLAYCPERVLPGNILFELSNNDRIVGGLTKSCSKKARNFYKKFIIGNCYIVENPKTAEMIKLIENSYRDLNIAFANELSLLSHHMGIDIKEAIKFANKHPRVNILNPGPGVGGHCIPIDPWFLIQSNLKLTKLMKSAREINLSKTEWVYKRIIEFAKKYKSKNLICLGLTYKKNNDDLRESPSLKIYQKLKKKFGQKVYAVEPNINDKKLIRIFDIKEYLDIDKTGIVIKLIDHKEFKNVKRHFKIVIDFS